MQYKYDYLSQNIDMPESFIEKLRGNYKDYEDFIHQKKQLAILFLHHLNL